MYLDLGRCKQDLHGARMDLRPEEPSLLIATPGSIFKSLLQRQSTSQGNMGDSEPPDFLCESCACIIPRGMKLSKQVYEISNLLEISSDEYH